MLAFILAIILTLFTHSISYASTDRPVWTEQSSFTFGDTFYAVGISSNAASSETGRQAAFINGLEEIKNYGQVSNLDGLMIETQMTYEQPQANGRVSVWRLLRVSIEGLRSVQATRSVRSVQKPQPPPPAQVSTTPEPLVRHTEPFLSGGLPGPERAKTPRSAAVSKPAAPKAQAVTTQEASLPTIPLRYPKVFTGWQRDSHGLAPKFEERPEWAMAHNVIQPSYASR